MITFEFMLRKSGLGLEFESELALEDFVWSKLDKFLGLKPLKLKRDQGSEKSPDPSPLTPLKAHL